MKSPGFEGGRVEKEKEEAPILKVILQRHGPKLSATGEKNALAEYFKESVLASFEKMDTPEGDALVHISSSPVQRATDTAAIEAAALADSDHRTKDVIRKETRLEVPFQPNHSDERYSRDLDRLVGLQKKVEPGVKEMVEREHAELDKETREAMVRNLIDIEVLKVFFDKELARELGLETPYEELADNLAGRYQGFLRHVGLLEKARQEGEKQPEEEPYRQIDITHSFPTMCFLKKYLVFDDGTRASELSSQEFFDRTGGVIPESAFVELTYAKDASGAYVVRTKGEFAPGKSFEGTLALV